MDGKKTRDSWLHTWYLRPLHWIFFAVWAPVLSLIVLIRERRERSRDRKTGRDRLK